MNIKLALLLVITSALASGVFALILHRFPGIQKFTVFILAGISGVAAIYTGLTTLLLHQTIHYEVNASFPNLIWQFVLDPLSSFFLIILGIIIISVATYGPGYVRGYERQGSLTAMYFFTSLFISSMYLVLLAHDVFTFMLAWEMMSVASYFLVIHNYEHTANRQAAFIYLLMAQTSGLLILFSFSLLTNSATSMSFSIWHQIKFTPAVANLAFFLALAGFGMKAGVMPLHVWLPKAHPAAPSHISALMSGVMLKVAVYGLFRFTFYFLGDIHWHWGIVTLLIGTISAIFGVLYALMQHDFKKLLAYSSIENIGIIFSALGLALIFASTNHPTLAALGLIAALYHCLNHAIFKSLLFLGAGAVIQATHEHDLEQMGGLIKKMPYTAWCFLLGCLSIASLPPLNGFVSEWLLLQTALQAPILKNELMHILIPVAAALLVLAGAIAATCFVKVYGIAFLGQARSNQITYARDPRLGMRFALGFLALLCLLLGIFPTAILPILNLVTNQLVGATLPQQQNWLQLIPLPNQNSAYAALLIGSSIILIGFISAYLLRTWHGGRTKTQLVVKPWDCGYGGINQRMQYSSTAFAMPLRRILQNMLLTREKIELINNRINYSLQISDPFWQHIYLPLERFTYLLARNFARLQSGNVRIYLTSIFITLILLLWIIT